MTLAGSNDITFTGTTSLYETGSAAGVWASTVTVSNTAVVTFADNIIDGANGAAGLFLTGAATSTSTTGITGTQDVVFSGNNTYSGGTYITGNLTLVADSNSAFGTGILAIASGTLLAGGNGAISLANNLLLNGQGVILGSSSYNGLGSGSTLNSNLTFTGGVALAVPVTTTLTMTLAEIYNSVIIQGNISGAGGLVVAGPGNLTLNGTSDTYAGGTVLNSSGTGVASSQYVTSANSVVTSINFNALNPELTRVDPSINYSTTAPGNLGYSGSGAFGNPPVDPAGLATVADGLIASGYVNIVNPGNYAFSLNSDDGGVLFVDGIVAGNSENQSNTNTLGTPLALTAGLHSIQVRSNNNGGNGGAMAYYSGPDTGNTNTIIPFGFLSNNLGTAGTLTLGNGSVLGSGPVSLSNGVLNAIGSVALNNTVSFSGGALPLVVTDSTAGNTITLNASAVLAGNVALSINNTTLQLNGDLAGTSGLATSSGVLAGPTGLTLTNQPVVAGSATVANTTTTYTGSGGTLQLNAPVTYAGPTTVASGTLDLANSGALPNTSAANQIQTIAINRAASGTFFLTANNAATAAIGYSSQVVAIGGATESGTTVTIVTSAVNSLAVGETVTIAGITPAGYNGTFTVASIVSPTSFTYVDASGLTASTVAGTETITAATEATNIQTAIRALGGNYSAVAVAALATSTANFEGFTVTFPTTVAQQPVMTINTAGITTSSVYCLASVSTTTNASAGITLDSGGTLTVDDSVINLPSRLNTSATLSLAGGTLNLRGNSLLASNQSLGAVTLNPGYSTINVTPGTGLGATLSLAL